MGFKHRGHGRREIRAARPSATRSVEKRLGRQRLFEVKGICRYGGRNVVGSIQQTQHSPDYAGWQPPPAELAGEQLVYLLGRVPTVCLR